MKSKVIAKWDLTEKAIKLGVACVFWSDKDGCSHGSISIMRKNKDKKDCIDCAKYRISVMEEEPLFDRLKDRTEIRNCTKTLFRWRSIGTK